MMTDPIADMLTRIRNAIMRKKPKVEVPASNMKIAIARILKDEGFIANYKVYVDQKKHQNILIYLKYGDNGESPIHEIVRVSKPGRRVYVSKDEIPKVKGGLGVAVLSTSKGVISDSDARDMGVGGELLFTVW